MQQLGVTRQLHPVNASLRRRGALGSLQFIAFDVIACENAPPKKPWAEAQKMRPGTAEWWMGTAFGANLFLAAIILATHGSGVHGTSVGLDATARVAFLLFWSAYSGGALTTLFRPGVSTAEATRAGAWPRFRGRTPGSSRSSQLALLDRLSPVNWRIHLFRTCCGPHIHSRTLIVWKPTHRPWPEAVAAVTDDRDECHTLCFSQGSHPRSVASRDLASR